MGDGVVQLARQLLALAQRDLLALAQPRAGSIAHRGADRAGEQEERHAGDRIADVAREQLRDDEPARTNAMPIVASRPEPQRNSAYGITRTYARREERGRRLAADGLVRDAVEHEEAAEGDQGR